MTGVELIAMEHKRHFAAGGHAIADVEDGQLAMAAACYAAPEQLFKFGGADDDCEMADPWPWERREDLRQKVGERRNYGGSLPADPSTCTTEERIELLSKAGAMIAAELDRLLNQTQPQQAVLEMCA
ncbi:hypothetical protein [Ralstonia pseudosolanacearum]|uniref:hypothetical protein n=1 Tax=Ralstonia pseudosolanacearum TaxID=1310165 RepID=UPI003CF203AF